MNSNSAYFSPAGGPLPNQVFSNSNKKASSLTSQAVLRLSLSGMLQLLLALLLVFNLGLDASNIRNVVAQAAANTQAATSAANSTNSTPSSASASSSLSPANSPDPQGAPVTSQAGANTLSPALKNKVLSTFQGLPLAFEPDSGRHDPKVKYTARTSAYSLFFTQQGLVLGLNLPNETADVADCSDPKAPKQGSALQPGSASAQDANKDRQTLPLKSCSALQAALSSKAKADNTSAANGLGQGLIDLKDNRQEKKTRRQGALALNLLGGKANATLTPSGLLSGTVNYLGGSDSTKWKKDLSTYQALTYKGVYSGVDLSFYGTQKNLEYDFELAAGADPTAIGVELAGADGLELDSNGNLLVYLGGNVVLSQAPPSVYQLDANGHKVAVTGGYRLLSPDSGSSGTSSSTPQYGFTLGSYDHSRPLVIDPVLSYSTYLGSTSADDLAQAVALDSQGNIYVTGNTPADNFPVPPSGTPYQSFNGGGLDVFVTKLNPGATSVLYSTYLGGESDEWATGLTVDSAGQVYLGGISISGNFPITSNAYQNVSGGVRGFLAKLSASGSNLLFSSYLGSGVGDYVEGLTLDSTTGRVWLTGFTASTTFPLTSKALQTTNRGSYDAFVAELDTTITGTAGLLYSTYLGGTSTDYGINLAVSGTKVYVAGYTNSIV